MKKKNIGLPNFTSMNVRTTYQTVSHSVASGISLIVALRVLPEEVKHAALFCEKLDKLQNALNLVTN